MAQMTIALPDLKVGDWAGYIGWAGEGYTYECWHEGTNERTGALVTFLHEQSEAPAYGDEIDALTALTGHMCDSHGLVTG